MLVVAPLYVYEHEQLLAGLAFEVRGFTESQMQCYTRYSLVFMCRYFPLLDFNNGLWSAIIGLGVFGLGPATKNGAETRKQ